MRLSAEALERLEDACEAAYATGDRQFHSDLRALLDFYKKAIEQKDAR